MSDRDELIRKAAGLLMPVSTDRDDYPHVPQYYLREVAQQNEKCRRAAIAMREAADRIEELEEGLRKYKRLYSLAASFRTLVGDEGDKDDE